MSARRAGSGSIRCEAADGKGHATTADFACNGDAHKSGEKLSRGERQAAGMVAPSADLWVVSSRRGTPSDSVDVLRFLADEVAGLCRPG